MDLLMALALVPVLIAIGIGIASVPLYFTTKMFKVNESSFGLAIKVTVLGWLGSIAIGIVMGILGTIIPLIPWLLGGIAPFLVYVYLVQHYYHLELMSALVVSVVQVLVSFALAATMVLAVLLPLGVLGFMFA